MNKQQLAAKIWASADNLRSKIEAYEYKDYILGLMFYMYLSDNQERFLLEQGWDRDSLSLFDQDPPTVAMVRQNLGYCIRYEDLFSSWLASNSFTVDRVSTAISAFNRSIYPVHKELFENIFESLETGLSKLGENAGAQTKALRGIINIISDIPLHEEQGYDVLGFVYEYLIGHFAAGAGKKAGEFYTPHEVSELMAKIVAFHLKGRDEVKIYDPTSGSGSLLITMGSNLEQYHVTRANIRYFAQELKSNTFNLTRMNLVMRGIAPGNIEVNNADTLEQDWPLVTTDAEGNPQPAEPLHVDAVVSNPPYSQNWDSEGKELDPRFRGFGLAPSSKADFAFLLHDLYHLNSNGIMTIVLPHGVLFRGGEEGKIREQLIKRNHIDAIIGLPSNIFFGTSIPTIVMVLKRTRSERDVLLVDASQGFIKDGKNNFLRAQDIQKVVDAVINRVNIDKFSRLVSLEEIKHNGYNLNLTRYVSAVPESEHWDLAGLTLGQLPTSELKQLHCASFFPQLQQHLFTSSTSPDYVALTEELKKPRNSYDLAIYLKEQFAHNSEVQAHHRQYQQGIALFLEGLKMHLTGDQLRRALDTMQLMHQLPKLKQELFTQLCSDQRFSPRYIVAPYGAYQCLYDNCQQINEDLEILQGEGLSAFNQLDDITETKKNRKGELVTKVLGQEGRILPLALIKQHYCSEQLHELNAIEGQLAEIEAQLQSLLDSLSEEDKELYFVAASLNEEGDAWNKTNLSKQLKNKEVQAELQTMPELNQLLNEAATLLKKGAALSKAYKQAKQALEAKAQQTLSQLDPASAFALLELKWFTPLQEQFEALFSHEIERAAQDLAALIVKYQVTPSAIEQEITQSNQALSAMLCELTTANSMTQQGLNELKQLLQP